MLLWVLLAFPFGICMHACMHVGYLGLGLATIQTSQLFSLLSLRFSQHRHFHLFFVSVAEAVDAFVTPNTKPVVVD